MLSIKSGELDQFISTKAKNDIKTKGILNINTNKNNEISIINFFLVIFVRSIFVISISNQET